MVRNYRGFRRGLAVATKGRYDSYIDSPAWRQRRVAWVAEQQRRHGDTVRCAVCSQPWQVGKDDLHHVDYARMGAERHEDLVPVHRDAHDRIHALIDGLRLSRKVPLPLANAHVIRALVLGPPFRCAHAPIVK